MYFTSLQPLRTTISISTSSMTHTFPTVMYPLSICGVVQYMRPMPTQSLLTTNIRQAISNRDRPYVTQMVVAQLCVRCVSQTIAEPFSTSTYHLPVSLHQMENRIRLQVAPRFARSISLTLGRRGSSKTDKVIAKNFTKLSEYSELTR